MIFAPFFMNFVYLLYIRRFGIKFIAITSREKNKKYKIL